MVTDYGCYRLRIWPRACGRQAIAPALCRPGLTFVGYGFVQDG